MSDELKQRYAKRLLQFKNVHNKAFLRDVAKNHGETDGNYISSLKKIN